MLFKASVWILSISAVTIFLNADSASAFGFSQQGFNVTAEPIIGYEFTQVSSPTIHTRGMLIYGARVTVGHQWLSGEGEYTMGSSTETFPSLDQNIKSDKQNARLGLRSSKSIVSGLDFLFRAGAQATQTKVTSTTISSGMSLTENPEWEIHPYAGVGLQGSVVNLLSISVEATYLFRSVKDWSQNDVQTTASLRFALPTD
jgi:hypothetical protein